VSRRVDEAYVGRIKKVLGNRPHSVFVKHAFNCLAADRAEDIKRIAELEDERDQLILYQEGEKRVLDAALIEVKRLKALLDGREHNGKE
jgi:hypothetical protein